MAETTGLGLDKPRRLEALTALRFFAAAAVVLYHSQEPFGLDWSLAVGPRLGSGGVTFFFVLSGFILAYVYSEVPTLNAAGRFLQARIARVWPAHLAGFLVCIWLLDFPLTTVATFNVFLVHGWVPYSDVFFSYNAPSWSISTELFFYLCFPLLIYRWGETWVPKLALSAALLACIVIIATWLELPAYPEKGVTSTGLVYIHPLGRILEFVFGMSCARYFRKARWPRDLSVRVATGLEVASLLLVLVAAGLLVRFSGAVLENLGSVAAEWFAGSGLFIVFGVLIVVFAAQRGVVSRALSWYPFVLLGEISFAIYLFHYTFFRYFQVHKHLYADWPATQSWLVFCVLTLVASYCCWLFVERPARQWMVSLGRTKARYEEKAGQKGGRALPSAGLAGTALAGLAVVWAVVAYPIWEEYQSFDPGLSGVPTAVKPGGACSFDGASTAPVSVISFVKGGDYMRFSGWAVDTESESVPEEFYITLQRSETGSRFVVEGRRHGRESHRPDVAQHFGSDRYLESGWGALVDIGTLPDGFYQVHGLLLTGAGYRICDTSMLVEITRGTVALVSAVSLRSGKPSLFMPQGDDGEVQRGGRCSVEGGVVEPFSRHGEGKGSPARLLKITGWAIGEVARPVPEGVEIRLVPIFGGGSHLAQGRRLRDELPRPDVAEVFGDPSFVQSGWELRADASECCPGGIRRERCSVRRYSVMGVRDWKKATDRL